MDCTAAFHRDTADEVLEGSPAQQSLRRPPRLRAEHHRTDSRPDLTGSLQRIILIWKLVQVVAGAGIGTGNHEMRSSRAWRRRRSGCYLLPAIAAQRRSTAARSRRELQEGQPKRQSPTGHPAQPGCGRQATQSRSAMGLSTVATSGCPHWFE